MKHAAFVVKNCTLDNIKSSDIRKNNANGLIFDV